MFSEPTLHAQLMVNMLEFAVLQTTSIPADYWHHLPQPPPAAEAGVPTARVTEHHTPNVMLPDV